MSVSTLPPFLSAQAAIRPSPQNANGRHPEHPSENRPRTSNLPRPTTNGPRRSVPSERRGPSSPPVQRRQYTPCRGRSQMPRGGRRRRPFGLIHSSEHRGRITHSTVDAARKTPVTPLAPPVKARHGVPAHDGVHPGTTCRAPPPARGTGRLFDGLVYIGHCAFVVKGDPKTSDSGAFESKTEKNDQKPRVSPCLSYHNGVESALALPKTGFRPSKRPIFGVPRKGRFRKVYTEAPLADARGSDPAPTGPR